MDLTQFNHNQDNLLYFKYRGSHIYFTIAAVNFGVIYPGSEPRCIKHIVAVKIFLCQYNPAVYNSSTPSVLFDLPFGKTGKVGMR